MSIHHQIQPVFDIKIKGLSEKLATVTPFVDWGIVYEERADMIKSLNFTINKYGEVYLQKLKAGLEVTFSGGVGGVAGDFRKIFVGNIIKIRCRLGKDGTVSVSVECLSTSWQSFGKTQALQHVYPDVTSKRTFATGKKSLKVSDIVRGIAAENNFRIGTLPGGKEALILPDNADKEYSLAEALHQERISDWALLRRLAKMSGCTVWTEFNNDSEELFFIDRGKVRNTPHEFYKNGKEMSFLYPLKAQRIGDNFVTEGFSRNFVYDRLQQNQILIIEATLEEDIAAATAVSYSSSRIDYKTGEEVSAPMADVITEKGVKKLIYYELNDAAVAELEKKNPRFAKELRDMGAFNIPWDIAKKFYKPVEKVDYENHIWDQAFFGITITATVHGNLNIRSQRAYRIYGIPRYGSIKEDDRFWAYSLKHRWEKDGAWTDIVFKQ